MILFVLSSLVLLGFIVFIGLVIYARWNYGVLEATGIPVIEPSFFMGSVPDLHRKVQTEEDILRFKEYGPTWGVYEGRTPIVYTCDPDLIRAIFVKDVEYFYDRRVGHFGDARIDEILDYLPGEKWRKMRKLQTVLFSSGKIRQYSKQLTDAAYDFVDYLSAKDTKDGRIKLDTRNAMDIVSLDGIARVSFGIKLENVEDPNNAFFRALKKLLGEGQQYDWLYSLSMVFPFLHKVAPSFQLDEVLFDTFRDIIKERSKVRNPAEKCNDLADFLVDCFENISSSEFKRLGITETTLLAQALNVTSLDMISATMTMISYYMAMNPEVQQKLHDEIDSIIVEKHGGRIDAETIHELPYLSACLDEALRLAPPLIRPERICTKDWTSPDGSLKIRKGTVVMVPLWGAHRNPKYFPDPEKFDPERFLPGSETYKDTPKHPYAYSPFGLGPRACIGMRLAVETLKANVCVFLKEFQLRTRPDTRFELKSGGLFLLQFKPMFLDLIKRNNNNNNRIVNN